ncbi:MAG: shikimate kinase [Nautiliaceae bacterium]
MSCSNIILTGFMGSGKSTIGRVLAKELDTYFIDTDSLIESFENRNIKEIFEKDGEDAFREMEKRCFRWIKNHVSFTVISVGGGFPVFVPEIKEAGVVIYLKVDFEDIVKRLSKEEIDKRPLFKDLKKAKELFLKRDEIYSKLADIVIENRDLKTTIKKIKEYYASK